MSDRLLDTMLGKLATYLRMCGYDTAYALDEEAEADDALLERPVAGGGVAAGAIEGTVVRVRNADVPAPGKG